VIETDRVLSLPDPLHAIGGNLVVLDHGNGEFSLLGHMMQGSVRVGTGDSVEPGQVLGLVGNSGNSDAPHLHYHLMAGDTLFQTDGLPTRFKNVVMEVFTDSESDPIPMPTPKRGLFLVAQ
jgi:murein DD-endopeptidase MepM/ murein hydrolase activator NlpD